MVHASIALVALREFVDRLGASAGRPIPCHLLHPVTARSNGCSGREIDPRLLRLAVRHAWLAVEMALAGPSVHERLGELLSRARGPLFREQVEVLIELLGRAGLDCDDLNVCRDCSRELCAARSSSHSLPEPALTACEESTFQNGAVKGADNGESDPLIRIARDFERAGYPRLARVVGLRSLWDEPLFLGIVEFFLRRALGDMAQARPVAPEEDCWRCLEMTADLLEEREEDIAALLDRSEEIEEPGPEPATDAGAAAALSQLGTSCCRRGDYTKAVTHFTAALKLDPTNALVFHQRGETYRLLCKFQRAIADFQVAVRLSPQSPAILAARAIAYYQSGEHARAIADCTAALALEPENVEAYRTRARAATELGNHAPAIADLDRVVALSPQDDEAHYLRGLCRARLEDFAAAVADFDRTLELNSRHVPAWLLRGHAHRRLGNFDRAIRDYTTLLQLHPGNALAFSGRGLAHKLRGNRATAIADFTEAVRLGSKNALDYFHRGTLHRENGDLPLAQADLDESLRLQPVSWPALYCRGKIHFAQGQYSLAVLDLTEVVRLDPTHVAGYLSRALAFDRLGRYPDGIADADRAIELKPSSPAAYLVRAVLRAHQGNRSAALVDQTETIRLDERLALAYHERAMTYTLQGDYDSALADCKQFIALEPSNAQGYATRSIVYHFKGDVAQAVTDYVRALQLDPKRMMTWWNEPVSESARRQAAQQVADYIDGLRHEVATSEPSLSEFQIVIRPAAGKNGAAPVRPAAATVRKREKKTEVVKEQPATAEASTPTVEPEPAPVADSSTDELHSENASPDLAAEADRILLDDTETIGLAPTEEPAAEINERRAEAVSPLSRDAMSGRRSSQGVNSLRSPAQGNDDARSPALVTCTNCSRQTTPAPVSEGRGRCEYCKSVFPLGVGIRRPVPAKETKPPFLETWKRPLTIGAGLAAAVLLVVVLGPKLFGSGRVRVYRTQGKAAFEGKPMARATIILHPVGEPKAHFPLPCATVQADGTFVLGTYRKGDGVPAGEYKATVQWVVEVPGSPAPMNVVPAQYSEAKTSDLTVRIKSGTNTLPPWEFTRAGKK
jgi:tetratricopeptide (TPR) repeat protein